MTPPPPSSRFLWFFRRGQRSKFFLCVSQQRRPTTGQLNSRCASPPDLPFHFLPRRGAALASARRAWRPDGGERGRFTIPCPSNGFSAGVRALSPLRAHLIPWERRHIAACSLEIPRSKLLFPRSLKRGFKPTSADCGHFIAVVKGRSGSLRRHKSTHFLLVLRGGGGFVLFLVVPPLGRVF